MNAPFQHVVLGVTGGIAAYKSAELLRLLTQAGVSVQVVMTAAATRFVTPTTFQALSGRPVFTDLWDARVADNMAHIALSRPAQAIVVAPASADFLAKLVHGLADDLLATLCLARDCPLLVAPAMNRQMWEHPATQRNLQQLRRDGVVVAEPASGNQACGETGVGRMREPAEILAQLAALNGTGTLASTRVLLTAGPTFEAIDAVRGITNRSSGRMGYALAQAAIDAGADVTLISGPVALAPPTAAAVVQVESAAEMFEAVMQHIAATHIFISVAAVADYTAAERTDRKLKKSDAVLSLQLKPTRDILAAVAAREDAPFCVGFAAESENLAAYAEEKRRRKKLPMIVANLAQDAIGAADNTVTIFDEVGAHPLPRGPKESVARSIIAHIAQRYHAVRPTAEHIPTDR